MRKRRCFSIPRMAMLSVMLLVDPASLRADDRPGVHWPTFRGPGAVGFAEGFTTPSEWDAASGKNIQWKTPIPGLGHGSPVIWGDRVYIVSAESGGGNNGLRVGLYGDIAPVEDPSGHTWRVLCLDKRNGEIIWNKIALEAVPRIKRHPKASHANSTPAIDGRHVVAFLGAEGLFCFDANGELMWKKDLGPLDSGYYVVPPAQWGFGSSPVIHDNRVIIQCDVQKDSFLAALDIETGSELWRTPRNEVPTWGTPTVHVAGDRRQIIVNGYKHIGGYDLMTGKEIWKLTGGGDIPVPTPVVAGDLVYITNAHGPKAPVYAIRTSASGDISLSGDATKNDHIAWSYDRRGSYMQTPLVYRGMVYAARDNGVLTAYDAAGGDIKIKERIGNGSTGFTASPVAADGKVYYTSEEGDVYVLQAGPEFKLLATNALGEVCMTTPAISEGKLYFRTQHHVWCVGG